MGEPVAGVGIIGCGVISAAYLRAARRFPQIRVTAVADLDPKAAAARAAEFQVPAMVVEALLASPAVDIVLNLTIPRAHVEVGLAAIAAGKHVYGEKPLGVSTAEARRLIEAAEAAGLRVGAAPDTFLGGAHQTARALIDRGAIGEPVAGTAFLLLPGHERWHPNPDFYYARAGGGPMMDMGPYYITDLVALLGPVARVAAMGRVGRRRRVIQTGPRTGTEIEVDCTTHVAGVMTMASGAIIQIATSFEVFGHRHGPLEIYGTAGSLLVPDPNGFGGEVQMLEPGGEFEPVPVEHGHAEGDHRGIGLADLAAGIAEGRPHRARGELAFHVLEVMEALIRSAEEGGVIDITTTTARPAPLAPGLAVGELR